jgi:hypothetical protein
MTKAWRDHWCSRACHDISSHELHQPCSVFEHGFSDDSCQYSCHETNHEYRHFHPASLKQEDNGKGICPHHAAVGREERRFQISTGDRAGWSLTAVNTNISPRTRDIFFRSHMSWVLSMPSVPRRRIREPSLPGYLRGSRTCMRRDTRRARDHGTSTVFPTRAIPTLLASSTEGFRSAKSTFLFRRGAVDYLPISG